jgi:hypothetical protein
MTLLFKSEFRTPNGVLKKYKSTGRKITSISALGLMENPRRINLTAQRKRQGHNPSYFYFCRPRPKFLEMVTLERKSTQIKIIRPLCTCNMMFVIIMMVLDFSSDQFWPHTPIFIRNWTALFRPFSTFFLIQNSECKTTYFSKLGVLNARKHVNAPWVWWKTRAESI